MVGRQLRCEFDGIPSFDVSLSVQDKSEGSWKPITGSDDKVAAPVPFKKKIQLSTLSGESVQVSLGVSLKNGAVEIQDSLEEKAASLPLVTFNSFRFKQSDIEGAELEFINPQNKKFAKVAMNGILDGSTKAYPGSAEGFQITFPSGRKLACLYDSARKTNLVALPEEKIPAIHIRVDMLPAPDESTLILRVE